MESNFHELEGPNCVSAGLDLRPPGLDLRSPGVDLLLDG